VEKVGLRKGGDSRMRNYTVRGELLLSESPREHGPDVEQSNVFLSQRKIEAAQRLAVYR
jgi:hypothetical protein